MRVGLEDSPKVWADWDCLFQKSSVELDLTEAAGDALIAASDLKTPVGGIKQ